jgi:hypothetical protein
VQNGAGFNRAAGVDGTIRFFSNSQFTSWISHVMTSDRPGASTAANASLLVQNDKGSAVAEYLQIGRNFDPAVGFVRRRDMVRYRGQVGWYSRPAIQQLRQVRFLGEMQRIDGHASGDFESGRVALESRVIFRSLDEVTLEITRDVDNPATTFMIANTPVQPGRYDDTFASVEASTNNGRRMFGSMSVGTGTLYGADRTRLEGNVNVKISPYLRVGGKLERNLFDFPQPDGRVSTTLVSVDAFVATGRKLYSQWLIQYDSVSRDLQANIRVRMLYRPGSDIFLVFNNVHRFDDRLGARAREFDRQTVVAKITYLLAF